MKIFDISQEVFGCEVFDGDPSPKKITEKNMLEGDGYNLTSFSMCAHNGTHIDAPYHFFSDGKTVENIPLDKTVGECYVVSFFGELTETDAEEILKKAHGKKKILLKGNATVTKESAEVLAKEKIDLIGVESQSVGPLDAPKEVHEILLAEGIVLLEGLRLNEVEEGDYFLSATPLKLGGSDGAPCRAILIEF